LADHPVDWIRQRALFGLAAYEDDAARKKVVAGLNDDSVSVKMTAFVALARTGDLAFVGEITKQVSHPDFSIRSNAVYALGYFALPESIEMVTKTLGDSSQWVRASAASALGNFNDESACDALFMGIKDSSYMVRAVALESSFAVCNRRFLIAMKNGEFDKNQLEPALSKIAGAIENADNLISELNYFRDHYYSEDLSTTNDKIAEFTFLEADRMKEYFNKP
jgi:HEAT repeat protein